MAEDLVLFGSLLPSVVPELEALGLHTEVATLRDQATRRRVEGLRIYGSGIAAHKAILEDLGFTFDRPSGSYLSSGPVDKARLLLAFPVEMVVAPVIEGPAVATEVEVAALEAPTPDESPVDPNKAVQSDAVEQVMAGLSGATARSGLFSEAPRPVQPPAPPEAEEPSSVVRTVRIAPQAVVIGVNANDAAVFQTDAGDRFYKIPDQGEVYEDEEADRPGLFLRAPTLNDLVVVARGLISPALKGRTLGPNELDRYLDAVNATRPDAFTQADLVDAVYAAVGDALTAAKTPEQARAMASRLHRFTGGSFAAMRGEGRDPFPILNAKREIAAGNVVNLVGISGNSAAEIEKQILGSRPESGAGRTLVQINGFGAEAPTDEAVRAALGDLPSRYVIEGSQFVVEPLVDETTLYLSIGARRPQQVEIGRLPAAVWQVGFASAPEPLTVWLDGIAEAQAAAAVWFEAIQRGEVQADSVEVIEQNRWQVPARTLSNIGKPTLMIPVNLKGALDEAHKNFLSRHPEGADAYVAARMRRPVSSLGPVYMPEQIDSLAFDFDAEERDRGFLVANYTGTGKGQVGAGRIEVSVLDGYKVLVLTEQTVGLGTLMRDLINIGAFPDVSKMALLNAGNELTEAATSSVVFPRRSVAEVKEQFYRDGKPVWPEGVDIVLGTYSCFNREGEDSWRTEWLQQVIDKKTHLVLDESHKIASAESRSAENMVDAIAAAGHTMYLSATYAVSGDKTGPYFSLIAPNADAGMATVLPQTISNAGEAGHEEFGNLLVRDGAMVRFERSFEEAEFSVQMSKNAEANREKLDHLAPVIRQMLAYAAVVRKAVALQNVGHVAALKSQFDAQKDAFEAGLGEKERKEQEQARHEEWDRVRKNGKFRAMSFGSPLYRIQKAFNASVMVDDEDGFVNAALTHLREGRKPIIAVDQTSESIIKEVRDMAEEMGVEAPEPTFKHLLQKILKTMGRAVNRNRERIDVADDKLFDAFEEARAISQQVIDGLCEAILTLDQGEEFSLKPDDGTDVKPAEKLRIWLDQVVPETLDATFTQIGQATGQEMSLEDKEKIRAIVGVVIEDGFMTTASTPSEIVDVLREQIATFDQKFDMAGARQTVEEMIDALPDMPISFIDVVKNRIVEAGYKIGEITGRSTAVGPDGKIYSFKRERTESVRDRFNNADYDAVVLNSAGASQIDLHSAGHFKNQGQRVLMVLQIPPVATLAQMAGRVDRIGQVIPPKIEFYINGMPTEVRFLANMNQHLARMNANLSSMRKHPLMCEYVPPLLTRDGDIAVARVLLDNPNLVKDLDLDLTEAYLQKVASVEVDVVAGDDADVLNDGVEKLNGFNTKAREKGIKSFVRTDNRRLANEVLSRAAILPSAGQSELLREVEGQYYARIEEREALGLDTSGVKMLDAEVNIRARRLLDPGDGDLKEHLRSAFRSPLYLNLANLRSRVEPMRGKDVLAAVNRAIEKGEDQKLLERIAAHEQVVRQSHERMQLDDAGARGLDVVDGFMAERAGRRAQILNSFPIGGGMSARHEGEILQGVVVGYRDDEFEPAFEVALPGVSAPRKVTMSAIMSMPSYKPWEGLAGSARRKTLRMFDEAGELSRIEQRVILTGNNWKAVQLDAGKIVTWTGPGGEISRGVMLPKGAVDMPPGIMRIRSVETFVGLADDLINHHRAISIPLLPWAGGVGDFGVELEMRFSARPGRNGAATAYSYTATIRGASTAQAKVKGWNDLRIAEKHIDAFLAAGQGLVSRIVGRSAEQSVREAVNSLRMYVADGQRVAEIPDRVERAKVRRAARQAETVLKDGIPLRLKSETAYFPTKEAFIDGVSDILSQAYEGGLEAIHKHQIDLRIKDKELRAWMVEGGWKPMQLDGFTEVEPPLAMQPDQPKFDIEIEPEAAPKQQLKLSGPAL